MAVTITLNGTDWTLKITDLGLEVKDNKQSVANIKGDGLSIPPRSRAAGKVVKLTFSYLSVTDYVVLETLYQSKSVVVVVFTGFDVPSGDYNAVSISTQLVKVLDGVAYNVVLELQQNTNATVPEPVVPDNPLLRSEIGTHLGL